MGGKVEIPGVNRIINSSTRAPSAPWRRRHRASASLMASATKLREAIAGKFGLDPARIVCGNGSDELIAT